MDSLKPQLPKISNEDRTPLVDVLLELLAWQQIQIDKLEQEILKLKGETAKPKIKPSKMDEGSSAENSDENGDDGGKHKKSKGPKLSWPFRIGIIRAYSPQTSLWQRGWTTRKKMKKMPNAR